MNELSYVNYHRHSTYTNVRISDCAVSNEDYANRAAELNHAVLSSCEHGWQGNVWDIRKLCNTHDLKMLVASEPYWVKDRLEKDNANCHIFMGAKNENGRLALNDVLSEANITGFYGRPRIDIPLMLSLPADDIWVTTACVAYWKYDDIEHITEELAFHFKKNFFLEVQYHDTVEQASLNKRILTLRDKLKIPLIMGCDSHYIYPQQAQNRSDFLEAKEIRYPEEDGWFLDYPTGKEAYERFAKQGILSHDNIIEAISNTNVFNDVEEYDSPIFTTDIKMPTLYPDLSQEEKDKEYERLVWSGWDSYKKDVPEDQHELYCSEIQKEIDTVVQTHTADYFITNHYIIKKGIENGGKLTKTGRGSAVSFITNMLLGFTGVDRIKASVKMYPERFMSATRILQSGSLPDIDHNVSPQSAFADAQQQVLGEDHAYPMVAYGTMKKSKAWKLYAKSQGIPFELANAVSADITKYEEAVKRADEDDKDSIDIMDYIEPQFRDVFQRSSNYLGLIDSWSIAPCSYLLFDGSIRREIGLVKVKDHICCCMDGHWAEECHFLKNDILKVSCVDLIYGAYKRAGIELPNVNRLLEICSPEDDVWKLYENGCTQCLNQCERPGTSARVRQYKPHNISELAAFVAAIRPGFKSMYKIFESREPFSYGVQAFDELIQTKEMPNSFVLYQEQEMAALNYAGIEMSDCYTAIKNIAKKRTDKVLAYKDKFIDGFSNVMVTEEGKTPEEAAGLSDRLWKIIEDSASYSFNSSHSYCVALDSLYEAWIKAHHPIAFYETALRVYDVKGDKDKMGELKEEAERYFGIKFPPFRYGQDNRQIVGDEKTMTITNSIRSIKGFGQQVGDTLWELTQELEATDFFSVLMWLDQHSIKSSKVIPLIQIDYFQRFGNSAELLRLVELFDILKQGTAKTIKKDKLDPTFEKLIKPHATDVGTTGNILKSYTITDITGLLRDIEAYIFNLGIQELSYKVRAANQGEILGYVDLTTNREEDRKKLYILDKFPLKNKTTGVVWKYKIKTKSVGSGKVASLDVAPRLMERKSIGQGDIIYAASLKKDTRGYWQLLDYEVLVT